MIRNLEAEDKEYHIVGDLNCNLLEAEKNVHSKRFIDIMDIYQLEQIITEPTRVTIDTSSLIDVFITNIPQKVKYSGVIRLCISDHYMIYVCMLSLCKYFILYIFMKLESRTARVFCCLATRERSKNVYLYRFSIHSFYPSFTFTEAYRRSYLDILVYFS
jgi:hypothetical protein